ncbi:MAG TPA: NIPSNAP family protein [Noviherbaspirillum sp.]|uniref:NIPSNAP family protein n=1 Tax=Noviherbaspirillum sp. TaxID=1926288 RepID=UPI002B4967AD|nr:NIPSNAP family protein [Noviherbaspirillum sp.]HJV86584.1 NIPSNAP family protein [Noviherbaspirillum sp.]
MSIFMKATMKVDAYKCQEFVEVLLSDLIPLMEDQGWKLHGCFVERFGPIKPAVVVDIWEMENMAHVERVMKGDAYRNDPRYQRAMPVVKAAVLEESVTFMEKRGGSLKCFYE